MELLGAILSYGLFSYLLGWYLRSLNCKCTMRW